MEHTELDYAAVGLKVGLEVHQQLLTEKKMFCNCPAGLYTRDHDGTVLRHMRPTLSELGEYDGTALMEFKTRKNIIYLLNHKNVCTYEMDDTPPFLVNQQALDVAIEQCLMLGCDIVDEVHIARKQYLDGSIPTGFQRTAIVGVSGKLPFRDRELSIIQVSMEEDSCREVVDQGHLIVWRTDRLGMPLIETVTGPELHTPDEVAEAILLLGRVCRSTGHVRTGMGASRQDVNVSVRGGQRVEIKGVPKAGWAPKLVHGEAVRQVNLLKLREELHRRGFRQSEDLRIRHRDVSYFLKDSKLESFSEQHWLDSFEEDSPATEFEKGKGPFRIRAVKLAGLRGTLRWPGQPGLTFAHELAGRVRVIATLDRQPILLHSEKWPDYESSKQELDRLRSKLKCGPEDSFVIVWGAEQDTITAAEEIRIRYEDAMDGVPNETRQPFEDGSTQFERILPGPDRMYPDTDSPPHRVVRERVQNLQEALAPPPWEREARYGGAGVPQDVTFYLIRRNIAALVDAVVERTACDLKFTCEFFGERLKGLARAGVPVDRIGEDRWCELFEALEAMPVLRQAWFLLVRYMAGEPETTVGEILARTGLGRAPEDWREQAIGLMQDATFVRPCSNVEQEVRYLVGQVMEQLRGQVDANDVVAFVTETLEARDERSKA
jgi:glutamyl-tRNA(Gln) amidotransferase subunit E